MARSTFRKSFAATFVTLLVLAACGTSGEARQVRSSNCELVDFNGQPDQTTTVVLWHSLSGANLDTLRELVERYERLQPAVNVRLVQRGNDYRELLRNFQEAQRRGQHLPDLIIGGDTWTRTMTELDEVVNADECRRADPERRGDLDDLAPSVRSTYTVDGALWPVAFNVSTLVLYYNRDAFRAAGLNPDRPPRTLDELRSAALRLRSQFPNGPLAFTTRSAYFEQLLVGEHQDLVTPGNGHTNARHLHSALDNPTSRQVLSWLDGMRSDGLLQAVAADRNVDHYILMAAKLAGMLVETSGSLSFVARAADGTLNLAQQMGAASEGVSLPEGYRLPYEMGIAEIPGVSGTGSGQVGGTAWYLIRAGSKRALSAAWDFAKFFNQVDSQVTWIQGSSYLPVQTAVLERLRHDTAWASTRKGAWVLSLAPSVSTSRARLTSPLMTGYDDVRTVLEDLLTKVAIDGTAPSTALPTASEQIDQLLSRSH